MGLPILTTLLGLAEALHLRPVLTVVLTDMLQSLKHDLDARIWERILSPVTESPSYLSKPFLLLSVVMLSRQDSWVHNFPPIKRSIVLLTCPEDSMCLRQAYSTEDKNHCKHSGMDEIEKVSCQWR